MTEQVQYAVPRGALYFQPRSRVDAVRFGVALPNAIALALIAGAAYGFGELQLRLVHFRIGAVIATAVALGLLAGVAIRFSRLSNRASAILFGTFIGFVGLWANWVTWTHAVLKMWGFDVTFTWLLNPLFLLRVMRVISRAGVWTYGSTNINGGQLVFYWVAEGLIIVLGCTLVAAAMTGAVTTKLLCPACRNPVKAVGGLGRFNGEDTSAVRSHLESHDFDYLLTLGAPPDEDAPEVVLRLECCPCGQSNLLSARRLASGVNAQGRAALTELTLVEGLTLTQEQVEVVKSLRTRLTSNDDVTAERVADEADPDDEDRDDDEDEA
jgi:hypothetical protein